MAVIDELIRLEKEDSISFGNYLLGQKRKIEEFKALGSAYDIRTYEKLTRLHKDGVLVFEAVPGVAVFNFKVTEKEASFSVEGQGDTQIIAELEPDTEYKLYIDQTLVTKTKSNSAGKISFSLETTARPKKIKIEKI